jgi:hypothetical protein
VFLRAKSKRVHVDTLIRISGVGLVGLDPGEVRSFTLREAVLAVQLELSSDNGVLAPAVHVQRGLSQNEGASIRDSGVIHVSVGSQVLELSKDGSRETRNSGANRDGGSAHVDLIVGVGRSVPVSSEARRNIKLIHGTSILEETTGINIRAGVSSKSLRTSESMDSVGEGINGISVVEGLSTENLEQESIADQRRAVVNVLIGLDDPDEFLDRVVEVELDLVGRRTNGLVSSELELSDQILVGVLGESAALISVEENIVNIERSSNQRLVVSNSSRDGAARSILVGLVGSSSRVQRTVVGSSTAVAGEGGDGPQALVNRTDIKVDLNFVILHITI